MPISNRRIEFLVVVVISHNRCVQRSQSHNLNGVSSQNVTGFLTGSWGYTTTCKHFVSYVLCLEICVEERDDLTCDSQRTACTLTAEVDDLKSTLNSLGLVATSLLHGHVVDSLTYCIIRSHRELFQRRQKLLPSRWRLQTGSHFSIQTANRSRIVTHTGSTYRFQGFMGFARTTQSLNKLLHNFQWQLKRML